MNPRSRVCQLFAPPPGQEMCSVVLCLLIDPSHSLWMRFLSLEFAAKSVFCIGLCLPRDAWTRHSRNDDKATKRSSMREKKNTRVNEICCVPERCKYNRTWTNPLTACTLFTRNILTAVQKNKTMTLWLSMWCDSQESSSTTQKKNATRREWKNKILKYFFVLKKPKLNRK